MTDTMKLWKIERQDSGGYDTFDMAVVAAESESQARHTSPDDWNVWAENKGWVRKNTMEPERFSGAAWTSPSNVTVTLIGSAEPGTERGVIVASFNAG